MFSFNSDLFGPLLSFLGLNLVNINVNVSVHRQVDVQNGPVETAARFANLETELGTLKKELRRILAAQSQQQKPTGYQKRGTRGDYRIGKARQNPRRTQRSQPTQLGSQVDVRSPDKFSDDEKRGFHRPSQTACLATTQTADSSKMSLLVANEFSNSTSLPCITPQTYDPRSQATMCGGLYIQEQDTVHQLNPTICLCTDGRCSCDYNYSVA
ncbi:hypothetical protein LX36DRAFT_658559 [Colletotrichum falcatum]|nr:hypothetical protein LX36DRAFT_658559 [Colletotrichum falcatum]